MAWVLCFMQGLEHATALALVCMRMVGLPMSGGGEGRRQQGLTRKKEVKGIEEISATCPLKI